MWINLNSGGAACDSFILLQQILCFRVDGYSMQTCKKLGERLAFRPIPFIFLIDQVILLFLVDISHFPSSFAPTSMIKDGD